MLTKLYTIDELKQQFFIGMRNNCGDKITKISTLSVINGFTYAISKLVQHVIKSAAQIEAKLFPASANQIALSDIALRDGVSAQRGANGSSVVLLFIANSGVYYPAGTLINSTNGIVFVTLADLTIESNGYGYVLANSNTQGFVTNVLANSITLYSGTPPTGHISVTNPFMAIGGVDIESTYDFKNRIMNVVFLLSRNTESFYESLIVNSNSNVLRIYTKSSNSIANINTFEITLVKTDLGIFSDVDILSIQNAIFDYLPLSDRDNVKINLMNIDYTYFNIYVPIRLTSGYTLLQVATAMQDSLSSFLDLSQWQFGQQVYFDDILEICRNTDGVDAIIDTNFIPLNDIIVSANSLPRINLFTIVDVISNTIIGVPLTNPMWIRNVNSDTIFNEIVMG